MLIASLVSLMSIGIIYTYSRTWGIALFIVLGIVIVIVASYLISNGIRTRREKAERAEREAREKNAKSK